MNIIHTYEYKKVNDVFRILHVCSKCEKVTILISDQNKENTGFLFFFFLSVFGSGLCDIFDYYLMMFSNF